MRTSRVKKKACMKRRKQRDRGIEDVRRPEWLAILACMARRGLHCEAFGKGREELKRAVRRHPALCRCREQMICPVFIAHEMSASGGSGKTRPEAGAMQ